MLRQITASWVVIGVLTMGAHAFAATTDPAPDPSNAPELRAVVPDTFVEHPAGDSGVTLRCPKSWTATEPKTGAVKLVLTAGPTLRNVNLVVVSAVKGETLQSVFRDLPTAYAKQFADFHLVKIDFVKLNGRPVCRVVFKTSGPSSVTVELCQFLMLTPEKDYILTYANTLDRYDALLRSAEEVAMSVKLP